MSITDTKLKVGKYEFNSRLLVGTGKYSTFEVMKEALEASGCDVVTVALRRVDLTNKDNNLLNFIDTKRYTILPNTAGCYNVKDAVKIAHLARELGIGDLLKLEVIGDEKTLLPDPIQTLEATKILVSEGYTIMAYTSDDIIMAKRLEEAGAAAVMPVGSPIGSGQGIINRINIKLIKEAAKVPIVVDAGVGAASDVAIAMELGADGVLLNTGIAGAKEPVAMAKAMKMACEAGRLSFLSGRIPKKLYATASSPMLDF